MVFPVTHLSSLSSLSYCLFSLPVFFLFPSSYSFLPSVHCQSSSTSYHLSFSYTSAFLLLRASLFSSGSGFLLLSVCLSSLSLSLFLFLTSFPVFLSSSYIFCFSSSFLSVHIFLAFSSSCSHPLNFFNFLLSLASYFSLPFLPPLLLFSYCTFSLLSATFFFPLPFLTISFHYHPFLLTNLFYKYFLFS